MLSLLASAGCTSGSLIRKPPEVLLLEEFTFSTFHLITLIIFVLAVIHTFSVNRINRLALSIEKRHQNKVEERDSYKEYEKVSFFAEILYFFGEVEVVFGLWILPLFVVIISFYNFKTALEYINTRDFTEPLFVIVVMALTATRPIVRLAEGMLRFVAQLLGGTVRAWWLVILSVGPLLGSLITEAGAMTLSAMLLSRQFYDYQPSKKLAYGTLGLLFTNISVGGVLTNFAAPPVLIIARCWEWSSYYMLQNFGIKVVVGVLLSCLVYFFFFRKDFQKMLATTEKDHKKTEAAQVVKPPIPVWITVIHILFVIWTVTNSHYPAIFIASYLLFLGFQKATHPYQFNNNIRKPLLVGFFLAALIVHGGLQGWWVVPLIAGLGNTVVMISGVVLTAFNDNASIAYLISLIPETSESFRYAIISGVVTGGGLTVIANAPNPAGYVILQNHFKNGISPLYLFLAAVVPTLIFFALFYFPFLVGIYPG